MKLIIGDILTSEDVTKIKECKDSTLDLSQNHLDNSKITGLFQALANNLTIKKLILNSVQFIDTQARDQFIKAMQNNQTITELDICDTPQLTAENQPLRFPITDILENNKFIKQLSLGNNKFTLLHALILKLFMNTKLNFLSINGISLTIEGLKNISKYLQNSSLTHLQIHNFKINNQPGEAEDCAAVLKEGLKKNTSLQKIELTELHFMYENNEKLITSILEEAAKKNPNPQQPFSPQIFSPKALRVAKCYIIEPKNLSTTLLQIK